MNHHDSRQAPGAEPAERAEPILADLRGDDSGSLPAGWEGYSPDTLAALDGLPPATC